MPAAVSSINTPPILRRVPGSQLPLRDFYLGRTMTFVPYGFKGGKPRVEQACGFVVGIKSHPEHRTPAVTALVPLKTLNFVMRAAG